MAGPGIYTSPQVDVYEQYQPQALPAVNSALSHVSGAHAFLLRYAVATEKALALLGSYVAATATNYAWPQLPVGAVVDPTYTKVFVDNARLEFYVDRVGAGDVIKAVAGQLNQIRAANSTYGFVANGVAWPRHTELGDRDVQAGDRALLLATVNGQTYSLDTYVRGFVADQTPTTLGPATSAPGNGASQTAQSSIVQTAGIVNGISAEVDTSVYSPYFDGVLTETYTVTVVQGSTGGDFRTAVVRVASASGLDDEAVATPSLDGHDFTVGRRGLLLRYSTALSSRDGDAFVDLTVGQTWTVVVRAAYTTVLPVVGGTYTGATNTTYIVTCTQGGTFGTATPPLFAVGTTTGVDAAAPAWLASTAATIPLGARGGTFTVAAGATVVRKGDVFYVPATAAAAGRYGTLILGHVLPPALATATDIELHLSTQQNIQLPLYDANGVTPAWAQSPTAISLDASVTYSPAGFTAGGAPLALSLVGGQVYVEYRAWRQTLVGLVGTTTLAGLAIAVPGPITPDNPLTYGVYCALLNSHGAPVAFTAVSDPGSLAAWTAVLPLLDGRTDIYSLAPLTTMPAAIAAYQGFVDRQSANSTRGRNRVFTQLAVPAERPVINQATAPGGAVVLGAFSQNPASSLPGNTLLTVTSANALFITDNVRVGDHVRTFFGASLAGQPIWTTYLVASVLTEDVLVLAAGPVSPVGVPQQIEVWHPLVGDEYAAAIATQAASYDDMRVSAVWPDVVGSGGVTMPGYFLCCALAGLRSGVVPHQSLTFYPVVGFDDFSRSTPLFNSTQLDTIAGGGAWIVYKDHTGVIKTRDALTTNMSSINVRQEMVVANVDAIARFIGTYFTPFLGVTNVTPENTGQLHTRLVSALNYEKTQTDVAGLGPQLIDYTIVSFGVDPVFADRYIGDLTLNVPSAVDAIAFTLVIE